MSGYVIARFGDGRAVMQGSHACQVRWGLDPARAVIYATQSEAFSSRDLLTDTEDMAYPVLFHVWACAVPKLRQLAGLAPTTSDEARA